jgi:hypothetical protein
MVEHLPHIHEASSPHPTYTLHLHLYLQLEPGCWGAQFPALSVTNGMTLCKLLNLSLSLSFPISKWI